MTELNVDGMALAPGVVETIVSIAANEVEGVACIGPSTTSGLRSVFGSKPSTQGIDITVDEEDKLHISIRVDVYYGYVLPDLAANIRQAISDAVTSQVGIPVGSVDVYIDGMQFARSGPSSSRRRSPSAIAAGDSSVISLVYSTWSAARRALVRSCRLAAI